MAAPAGGGRQAALQQASASTSGTGAAEAAAEAAALLGLVTPQRLALLSHAQLVDVVANLHAMARESEDVRASNAARATGGARRGATC